MIEPQPTEVVTPQHLLELTALLHAEGHRLVQIGATSLPDGGVELNYSFDKEGRFRNLRLPLAADNLTAPSITGIYFCAFAYENEIHDLFGIDVKGNKLDFKGNFYRIAEKTPFLRKPAAAQANPPAS
jgi:ech hydrogenase subunit D